MQNISSLFTCIIKFYMISILQTLCVTPSSNLYNFSNLCRWKRENGRLLWAETVPEIAVE